MTSMMWCEFRDLVHGLLQSQDTRLWCAIQPPETPPEPAEADDDG